MLLGVVGLGSRVYGWGVCGVLGPEFRVEGAEVVLCG